MRQSTGGGVGSAATCTAIIPAGNTGITATYTPVTYTLTLSPTSNGTYTGTPAGTYNPNTAISITANPNSNYIFSSWTATGAAAAACDGMAASTTCSFTMAGDASVTANYSSFNIGTSFQGGKVAYILQSGDPGYDPSKTKGLIAATSDQSTGIRWASDTRTVPGGTGTAIGTGSANTNNIISQQGAGTSYAAGLAQAYRGGSYSDWYLPSKNELNKLFANKSSIQNFVYTDYYWSSSEYIGTPTSAYLEDFSAGNWWNESKSSAYRVRAVRSFQF